MYVDLSCVTSLAVWTLCLESVCSEIDGVEVGLGRSFVYLSDMTFPPFSLFHNAMQYALRGIQSPDIFLLYSNS